MRAQEPPKDKRFTDLANVVLAPHVAGITQESQAAINQVLVSEIRASLTGGSAKVCGWRGKAGKVMNIKVEQALTHATAMLGAAGVPEIMPL